MAATKITVNNNGSIRVEGDFEIVDPTGAPSVSPAAPRSAFAAAAHRPTSPSATARTKRSASATPSSPANCQPPCPQARKRGRLPGRTLAEPAVSSA